ncbi:MAG: hypothetical protein ACLFNK_00775 [Candidatus Woesearchaeota archaeon]
MMKETGDMDNIMYDSDVEEKRCINHYVDSLKGMSELQLRDSVCSMMTYAALHDVCVDMDNLEIALYNLPLARDEKEMEAPLEVIANEIYSLKCKEYDEDLSKALYQAFPFLE